MEDKAGQNEKFSKRLSSFEMHLQWIEALSVKNKIHVVKNQNYIANKKSVAHIPRPNTYLIMKGPRITFAIDGTVQRNVHL